MGQEHQALGPQLEPPDQQTPEQQMDRQDQQTPEQQMDRPVQREPSISLTQMRLATKKHTSSKTHHTLSSRECVSSKVKSVLPTPGGLTAASTAALVLMLKRTGSYAQTDVRHGIHSPRFCRTTVSW